MSVDKWAYEPKKCEGHYCVGDCDFCELANVTIDEENDDEQ